MSGYQLDWPDRLRDFRHRRNLNQAGAAVLMGVSQSTWSRWERGAGLPTVAMQNRLLRQIRHDRVPHASLHWVRLFRQWIGCGTVESAKGMICATTNATAHVLGLPIDRIEGTGVAELFVGETVEQQQRTVEAGLYEGRVASFEACFEVEVDRNVRRLPRFFGHKIAWPHVAENGEILLVSQGRVVGHDEAMVIRERLGGMAHYVPAA